MTVATREIPVCGGDHAVYFYEHDRELAKNVGRYVADALQAEAVAIVVASEAHRRVFEAELAEAGIDPAEARRNWTLVWLDAAATLAMFMPGGRIDGRVFHRVLGGIVRQAANSGKPVRVYGEMVALLWEAGDVLAAIELETLWNELGREDAFSLLCAYRHQAVSGPEHAEALEQVCHLHSSVSHAPRRADEVSGRFRAEPGAPDAARRLLVQALRRWGRHGFLLDDARLVLSELATNAVVHARTPFSVVVRCEEAGLRVSVRDFSRMKPVLLETGPAAASGRGLRLVEAVASDWGAELTTDGKTVWAELHS